MDHLAAACEDASVARAMEMVVALEVRYRATQVRTNRAGYRKPPIPVAKDEDLFIHQERWCSEGKVSGGSYLECLRRFVKYAWHQEPDHRSKTYRNP